MAKKVVFTQRISDEIDSYYFNSEKDADEFDKTYREFIANEEALQEFRNACSEYSSYDAIMYNIQNDTFELEGDFSDELISAMENVIDTVDNSNPYCILYSSLFYIVYPKMKNYMWDVNRFIEIKH